MPTATGPSVSNVGKITPPTLHRPYINQRLLACLDDATARPVIWVQGPPGAGKTTLVASYLADRGRVPIWYRLDQGDADLATLFVYLAAAHSELANGGTTLPLLSREFRAAIPLFTRRFFRDLFVGPARTLVFDDYHEVAAGAALHDCLPHGLEEVPPGSCIMIISRGAPPAALARLRLNGLVHVLEPDVLKMTESEACGLANHRGAALDRQRLAAMHRRTQGWTAGLVLMLEGAEQTKGGSKPPPDVAVPELLFDYFAAEVLQGTEVAVHRHLGALSLMRAVTAAAAQELTGAPEVGPLLEDLSRRNYFVSKDLAAEPRYRFHPLFREFLAARMRANTAPEELALLRVRAAVILEQDGQPEAAIELLGDAGALDALAALIKRRAPTMLEEGRNETLTAWMMKLPPEQILGDAWLSYWRGAAQVSFAPAEAMPHLQNAFDLFKAEDDAAGQLLAWADLAEGVRADVFGDMTRFDALIASLRELVARYPAFPSPAVALKISVGMAGALVRRTAEREEIELWRERALAAARQLSNPNLVTHVNFWFAVTDLHDSNYETVRSVLAACPDPFSLDHLPFTQYLALFAHAIALVWRQQAGDCEAFMAEAVKRLELSGFALWLPNMTAYAVNDACRREDIAASAAWLRRTEVYADRVAPHRGVHYHYVAAQHHLMIGQLDRARKYASDAVKLAMRSGWNTYIAVARQVLALVLREQGDLEEARQELDRLDDVLARSATRSVAFSAKLMRAELAFSTGDDAHGKALLADAMAVGRMQGERFVMLHAAGARRICALAIRHDIEVDFVRMLIRSAEIGAPDPHDEAWAWPLKIRCLGDLTIVHDDKPLTFSRKTPKRLLQLLKAMLSYGAHNVPEEKLIDAVWPDEDGDAARSSFKIAVHRLRKLLGDPSAIIWKGGRLGLDPARCWLDLWTFEHLLAPRQAEETQPAFRARVAQGLDLYRGDFLAGDEDLWWTTYRRKQMRDLRRSMAGGTLVEPIHGAAVQ